MAFVECNMGTGSPVTRAMEEPPLGTVTIPPYFLDLLFLSHESPLKRSKDANMLTAKLLETFLSGFLFSPPPHSLFLPRYFFFSSPDLINRLFQAAESEGSTFVSAAHLQEILPQLLLDYV
jgi:hypothetical protein